MLKSLFRPAPTKKMAFEDALKGELAVLYRVARRMALNDTDAEDLVGQVLLQSAKAWDRFDGQHLRSWLIQILRNEHLANLRKKRRHPQESIDAIAEPSDEGFWEEVSWTSVGDELMAAVDSLPEEYRLAIALCDIEEMSYEEAAQSLGVPVGTVRSRIFRGRRLLRAQLAHFEPSDSCALP